jgi:hypothetical protein
MLTPKFGKGSDLWVQPGEKSVRRKEGFFRCIRQKNSAVSYLLLFGKGTVELILRDCTVTWLKRKGRMDGYAIKLRDKLGIKSIRGCAW